MKTRIFIALVFGCLLLTQFNNCSPSVKPGVDLTSSLAACDPGDFNAINNPTVSPNTNCALPDYNFLSVSPGGDQVFTLSRGDFNIGGACSEGGYPRTMITWSLRLNGQEVRNSGQPYNGQPNYNSQCLEGSFQGYVYLAADPSGDNVNRTGLIDPSTGQPTTYTLAVTIYGFDSNGLPHQNAFNGTRIINLNPQ
jgi:hypothetical protein